MKEVGEALSAIFFGVLLLGILNNALNIIGVSSFTQTIVLGAIIVVATVISNILGILAAEWTLHAAINHQRYYFAHGTMLVTITPAFSARA